LWELGEFYSAQGFESALPRGQRWQVLETCARTNPAALGVRYQVQRATDRAHGLWEYFRRLSLGSPPAWDRITLEVIRIALGDGLSESVGTYLRALLPRLPRHSLARRQCLARVRGLDQAAAW
jgi:hypothetical protein